MVRERWAAIITRKPDKDLPGPYSLPMSPSRQKLVRDLINVKAIVQRLQAFTLDEVDRHGLLIVMSRDQVRAATLLHIGWASLQYERSPVHIGKSMALATPHLLARVVAARKRRQRRGGSYDDCHAGED